MPRIARVVAPGFPHHITQRGNYHQIVFGADGDYERYKSLLGEYARQYGLKIWAYCLMSNHVHLICVPEEPESLALTLKILHMRYSQYHNRKSGLKGHLWQGRYFSSILDDKYLHAAVRYIENNPVRARIVEEAERYPWSSAGCHCNLVKDPLLSHDCPLSDQMKDWRTYLRGIEDGSLIKQLRVNSRTGNPCGDFEFVKNLERVVKKTLVAKARGRPRKYLHGQML